jgi:hypothetical protein
VGLKFKSRGRNLPVEGIMVSSWMELSRWAVRAGSLEVIKGPAGHIAVFHSAGALAG